MPDDAYDLSPNKVEMFKSQSGDLSLIDAVKELVDNAIDNWTRVSNREEPATVRIAVDESTTYVWDNTGGVPSDQVQALFAPGETRDEPPEWSIGGYALGAKKAISRLGGLGEGTFDFAHIKSRAPGSETAHGYTIDRSWFEKDDDWNVERETFGNLDEGCSEIVVGASEQLWDEESVSTLREELGRTYAKFLTGDANGQSADFEIVLDESEIDPSDGVEWSYIPIDNLYPRRYTSIELDESYLSTPIQMELEVGLMLEEDSEEAGTDIFFQDRLVVSGSTAEEGGFGTEDRFVGRFTSKNDRLKVRLELLTEGDASELPWDTQKKNIDQTSRISSAMYSRVRRLVKPYFDADSDLVSDAIATPYGQGSERAANGGTVKEVDVSATGRPERPRSNLLHLKQLRENARYHVTRGVYIDYHEYDSATNTLIDEEAIPAYKELVSELADDELDPVSPEEGKKVIEDVEELRRTLRSIHGVSSSKINSILDSNYISVDDLREASTYQLRRIDGIGSRTAQRIKDRLEPKEGIGEILEELASRPTADGDSNTERVFELYEKLLDFDSLPTQNDIDAVVEDEFPILTDNSEYSDTSTVLIPDNERVSEGLSENDQIEFAQTPKTAKYDITREDLYDLLERLGATRLTEVVEESVLKRREDEVHEQDSTPRERLNATWESITDEFSRTFGSRTVECPSIIWVSETGVQYRVDDAVYEEKRSCKYDSDKGEVYLTPDFVVDWETLAGELADAHGGSKENIAALLRKGSGKLEDQAIDVVRQHESDEFKDVIDVRDVDQYDGVDVQGCDILALPYGTGEPRFIEVKSRSSSQTPIHLIGQEPNKAKKSGKQYYLYIVVINEVTDSVRLWRLSDPANRDFEPETAWRINQSTWQEEGEEVIIQ